MANYAPFVAGKALVSRELSVLKLKYVSFGGFIIIMLLDITFVEVSV